MLCPTNIAAYCDPNGHLIADKILAKQYLPTSDAGVPVPLTRPNWKPPTMDESNTEVSCDTDTEWRCANRK